MEGEEDYHSDEEKGKEKWDTFLQTMRDEGDGDAYGGLDGSAASRDREGAANATDGVDSLPRGKGGNDEGDALTNEWMLPPWMREANMQVIPPRTPPADAIGLDAQSSMDLARIHWNRIP